MRAFLELQLCVAAIGLLWCVHGMRRAKNRYVLEGILLIALTMVVTVIYVWKVIP